MRCRYAIFLRDDVVFNPVAKCIQIIHWCMEGNLELGLAASVRPFEGDFDERT